MSEVQCGPAWLDERGRFRPVYVVSVSARSVRVVDRAADETVPAEQVRAKGRGVRPDRVYTDDERRAAGALRDLVAASRAAEEAEASNADSDFAYAVFPAMFDDPLDAVVVLNLSHADRRLALRLSAARLAARLAGWSEDVTTWHPAVRVVPADLVAHRKTGPALRNVEVAVVMPAQVAARLAREVLSRDPALLDVIARRSVAGLRRILGGRPSQPAHTTSQRI